MPSAPPRTCLEPGCTARQHGARCSEHECVSPRNHGGISPSRRGYDAGYRQRRAALLGAPCALRLRGCTGIATTADHVIPISAGGADGPLRPACAHCNAARGARSAPRAPQGAGVAR